MQFYLSIDDNSDVLNETTKVQAEVVNRLSNHNVNVEISLKTKEGDSMVLEVWTVNMDTHNRKPVRVRSLGMYYVV